MNAPDAAKGRLAHDVQALRDLAQGWREVSRRSRYEDDRLLRDDDPGPHMTAIQLEWAAREIERLRANQRTGRIVHGDAE